MLFAGLLATGVIWRRWNDSVMTVTVTISTDEKGPIDLYHTKARFQTGEGKQSLAEADIDIGKWEGELVRLDIRGGVRRWPGIGQTTGFVGCSVQLGDSTGARPIEFIGWQNDGSSRMHPGTIGSLAFVAPGEADPPFVYGQEGSLWYVFRVPEKAALKAAFRPVMEKDLKGSREPFVPSVRPPPSVLKESVNADSARPPDVFIYLIDALRADHLGCYGYPRPTSPAIDAFAEKATLFKHAQCAATWTLSSVGTLFTGVFPSVHEVLVAFQTMDRLDESFTLLPEVLQEAGYKTCLITANVGVGADSGFTQGIDSLSVEHLQTPDWVNAQAAKFLAEQDTDQPIYMYLHTMEPHTPYAPEPETFRLFDRGFEETSDTSEELTAENVEHMIDLYDAEIFDNDKGFAGFLDLLRRRGRYDNALIILLADHGESFGERGVWMHGRSLNQEQLHIPLIIKFPEDRFAGLQIEERVSFIDIFPTVVAQIEAAPRLDYHLPGCDLANLAAHAPSDPSRRIHAEVLAQFSKGDITQLAGLIDEEGYKRVIDTSLKVTQREPKKSVGLWDTTNDPKEEKDLSESSPVRAAYGEQIIAHRLVTQRSERGSAPARTAPPTEMSEELRQQLKALGYLD